MLLLATEWHFWIAPFLVIGTVLAILALVAGYIVKVVVPQTRRR